MKRHPLQVILKRAFLKLGRKPKNFMVNIFVGFMVNIFVGFLNYL